VLESRRLPHRRRSCRLNRSIERIRPT
jgi:hypothetical protein